MRSPQLLRLAAAVERANYRYVLLPNWPPSDGRCPKSVRCADNSPHPPPVEWLAAATRRYSRGPLAVASTHLASVALATRPIEADFSLLLFPLAIWALDHPSILPAPAFLATPNERRVLTDTGTAVIMPLIVWACSSAGRALQSHCRGQGFESLHVQPTWLRQISERGVGKELPIGYAPAPTC